MAVFTGAQLVSGLVAPTLLDRVPDPRVLLVAAGVLGGAGELGVWLAPELAPWLWALLLGAGQGAAFALGLGLLVRYAVTARDSARLTAMSFLVSYSVAAFGPAASGAVEDATGGYGPVWALLALVMVPQLVVSLRLGPSLPRVGS
jgi:CP family cyanate transporter-like MFS transporter